VIVLRVATPDDLGALLVLEQASFSGDRLTRRQLRAHLSSPRATLLVAIDGGQLLGYGLVFRRARSQLARVYSLCVAAQARGRGIASALIAALEEMAIARNARALRLEVRTDNLAARALYQARGYHEISVLKRYYEDGGDGVRLEKTL